MCAPSHTHSLAAAAYCPSPGILPFTGHQEPESRRRIVMTKVFERKSRTEAEAFLEEVYPLPITAIALISLLIGNVAVTVAYIAALG
jgi:hypothetical protein